MAKFRQLLFLFVDGVGQGGVVVGDICEVRRVLLKCGAAVYDCGSHVVRVSCH